MIDFNTEQAVTLQDAARLIPTVNGKPVHTVSLWRWATRGLCGVRLEYGRLGRRMVTSREALTRFMNRLAEADQKRLEAQRQATIDRPSIPMRSEDGFRRVVQELSDLGV